MYKKQFNEVSASLIYDALEPDQLSSSKLRFKRRTISRRLSVLLWALRFYALVMILLVILQAVNSFNK